MEVLIQPNITKSRTYADILTKDNSFEKSEVNSNEPALDLIVQDKQTFTTQKTVHIIEEKVEDLAILKRDQSTKKNRINKTAYAKLHRTVSPNRKTIDNLKEKYEVSSESESAEFKISSKKTKTTTLGGTGIKLDEREVQLLKNKYSPPTIVSKQINSKIPVPKPRAALKSQIILPSKKFNDIKQNSRYSLDFTKKPSSVKDENFNELYRNNSTDSVELVKIVTRSDSEESVDKFERELNLFMMDAKPKEKKRSNSFRRIFSGKIFGKEKRKKDEEKNQQYKENVTNNENFQIESNFNRQSPYRHTTGGNSSLKTPSNVIHRNENDNYEQKARNTKELEKQYANMHLNKFRNIKQAFENSAPQSANLEYVPMDKPMIKNSPGPTIYMNMPNVKKYIDTSSCASTSDSDRSNLYQNEVLGNNIRRDNGKQNEANSKTDSFNTLKSIRLGENKENSRDTPPRLQELRQDLRLVHPKTKALIPINSERSLPNPYHSLISPLEIQQSVIIDNKPVFRDNSNKFKYQNQPRLEETYGTVLDSLETNHFCYDKATDLRGPQKPPRSPSFESSKLKLPPNRDIVPLSPRVKSPIPHNNISTEKIIATELLKPSRSPTSIKKNTLSGSTHQNLEIDIDYPDNVHNEHNERHNTQNSTFILATKPPLSKMPIRKSTDSLNLRIDNLNAMNRRSQNSPIYDVKRLSQASPSTDNIKYRVSQNSPLLETQERITTNALVHINSSATSSSPTNNFVNRSLSPLRPQSIRSSTPVDFRTSISSIKSSPQKDDMRKSVEAYYWKELKKLKEQENYDYYMYQMQMKPYGYAEDPINVRRSRSLSPTAHRNSRRSLSLPRDPRSTMPQNPRDVPDSIYGKIQQEAIPEGRAVMSQANQRQVIPGELQLQPNFRRNTPERRTFEGIPKQYENYNNSIYRPIFKRGSLSTPVKELNEDTNKKVSFVSNAKNTQSWPTKNGFTQSPPQRRIETLRSAGLDDNVFLVNSPRTPNYPEKNELYSYANNPPNIMRFEYGPPVNEEIYYSKQNLEQNHQEVPRYPRDQPNSVHRYLYQPQMQKTAEDLYGQTLDGMGTRYNLTRHGSIQIQEPTHGQDLPLNKRMIYDSYPANQGRQQYLNRPSIAPQYGIQTREVVLRDEGAFGQFEGYVQTSQNQDKYNKRQLPRQIVPDPIYSVRNGPRVRQVSVRDKVCDIYGQIHERGSPCLNDPGSTARTGVLMGQLQGTTVQLPYFQGPNESFVRNTRLTASVNDMHSRYRNVDPRYRSDVVYLNQEFGAPTRPLPPVPMAKQTARSQSVSRYEVDSGFEGNQAQKADKRTKIKKRSLFEEEWNADGKSGRGGLSGNESGRSDNEGGEVRGRSRNTRRDDPRRHTLGGDQQYLAMAGQGGPLARTMDLEGQPRGYPPPSNAMLFDDDPGIMSEVETSSTGFRRGGKQRSSLPVVRTPSKTLERPLGLVFLQYRNETKRALLPNEITSIDTVKALFVRSFPKQLTMEYLDSPNVKIYIHDSSKDMFYELEDLRSHLREIRDRSVLRLFESADVSGGLPMAGIGIAGGVGHFEDPSYFSEPEFDSEYQHQHIHKSKGGTGKNAPYYMGSTASLPRGATLLRTYSPAVTTLPSDRMKTLPTGAPPKPQRSYSTSGAPTARSSDGPPRPPDRFVPYQRPTNPVYNVPDGYMSSPERGSRYEDPYYSQYSTRSGSITPVIDEEISDTELLEDSYSLYGVKLPPGGGPRVTPRSPFPPPASVPPYDATRLRVENMERQLANLTGLVQKALTQPAATHLQVPGRENYRGDEFDKNSSSSSASLPDKSVSFEKSVSFSDEPPDMNSPKQHSPQHTADTKPAKPAIKSSTLPRTSSQERDRLKPATPPKPSSALSPNQYDSRIYRDLQLTPEMYNQLRGLQKKAKDLRAEVRNLRRMSQAQAHSVKETIRDTFIKIRAMLLAGGEQVWQAGMDQERVRLSREEDLYKQEMLRLETDLSDLESTVEELRGNVINRKTRVNMSDVENMALVLSKSSKTVADLKLRFPGLQDGMKAFLNTEMDKMVIEEKFLKEEPERLESALRRCKKLTGTLVTLKRLASVQEQRLPCSNSNDGRISPNATETPPITPSSTQTKPPAAPRVGPFIVGGDVSPSDGSQRPENALDALLDELQTFSKPHPQDGEEPPPAVPAKSARPPQMSEIGRKGSMDSASFLPAHSLSVSTATGSLRRLHSYPSGSDTDNSPPIQAKTAAKPPIPERNAEAAQHPATGKRVPPPPPPRTSSKSPLASPTSPGLPPRSPAAGLQHIHNVQSMVDKPMSQFEQATQNLGLHTLRRNVKDKSQTLPRNTGSNLQNLHVQADLEAVSASNSSSCESVNSQDGSKKTRKEELEQRHQELLRKQKALQEQYARLQQLQRGNNTLAVVPSPPDQLLKKTGSESNLLQKMGLQLATSQITGSLTNLPSKTTLVNSSLTKAQNNDNDETKPSSNSTQTNKVYETDIL